MGGWVALLVALERSERVHSILSISNAADILIPRWNLTSMRTVGALALYWCKTNVQRLMGGSGDSAADVSDEDHSQQHRTPKGAPTLSAIMAARDESIFDHGKIGITCPVRLLHARNDSVVPYTNSVEIRDRLISVDVRLEIVEDADHRFSTPDNLEMCARVLDELLDIEEIK